MATNSSDGADPRCSDDDVRVDSESSSALSVEGANSKTTHSRTALNVR